MSLETRGAALKCVGAKHLLNVSATAMSELQMLRPYSDVPRCATLCHAESLMALGKISPQ